MKETFAAMRNMSQPAFWVLKFGLFAAICVLYAAFLFLLRGYPYSIGTYADYIAAHTLERTAFAVLFFAVFLSAFVEERRIGI